MAGKTLKVYANPWLHVDHEGRPCCAVEREEASHRWVGASPKVTSSNEAVTVGSITGVVGGEPMHDVTWEFSDEVQEVPDTSFYRDRIREGALVLADPADAQRLGIKRWVQGGKQELIPAGKSALARDPNATQPPSAEG